MGGRPLLGSAEIADEIRNLLKFAGPQQPCRRTERGWNPRTPTTNFYLLMLLHILYMPPAVRCGAITEGRQRQQGCDATTEAFATERGSTPQTSTAICMTTSLLSYDFHSVSRGCEAPRHNKGEREGNVSRMFRHRLGSAGRGGSNPPSPTKERRQGCRCLNFHRRAPLAAPTPKPVRVAYHKCYKNKFFVPPPRAGGGKLEGKVQMKVGCKNHG